LSDLTDIVSLDLYHQQYSSKAMGWFGYFKPNQKVISYLCDFSRYGTLVENVFIHPRYKPFSGSLTPAKIGSNNNISKQCHRFT
jgi:hypothetical protein